MKRIVKQVVGIDVAKAELVVCVGKMHDDLTPELYAHKTFPNTAKGFVALTSWVESRTVSQIPLRYVMEATGVYHESLLYFLDDNQLEVTVVLPNKISNYAKTLDVKTVTDKSASDAITRFGLERTLDRWKRPAPMFRKLKQLTRERDQLVTERTRTKNQLHAEQAEAFPAKKSIDRMKARIKLLQKQIDEIETDLKHAIKQDQAVKARVKVISSIVGIGELTAVTALAETNGFELIRNRRQLTSYTGFDVKDKQSGTSVKGKTRISKRGNRYLRKALYMPSLAAIRYKGRYKDLYNRLLSRHGLKMKALVAVQRKLLEMMYTIDKTNQPFDRDYLKKNPVEKLVSL